MKVERTIVQGMGGLYMLTETVPERKYPKVVYVHYSMTQVERERDRRNAEDVIARDQATS